MSVAVRKGEELTFITKGAPESVLPRCQYAEISGKREKIEHSIKPINSKLTELSEAGYRVLAVACKSPYCPTPRRLLP